MNRVTPIFLTLVLLAVGCGSGVSNLAADDLETDVSASTDVDGQLSRGEIGDLYDPTDVEKKPEDYRESLPRDAINPVYAPVFVSPSGVDWPGEELVIGVEFNGEARAYPVGFLTFREMVIDNHRGIPTLVTW